MTRKEAKRRAELYSILAEGKTIQVQNSDGTWEDIKIRKEIISILRNAYWTSNKNRFNELVDWLEKEGEQKPCMVQWKGDNLKEVISFTGKDKNFGKWFKSFEEYEKYVHEHNDIFKLFNENGSHYEIPVGAWIVKTPDGYNIASNAVLKQKSINERAWLYLVSDVLTWKDGIGQYLDDPRVQELAKRLCNDYANLKWEDEPVEVFINMED